MVCRAREAGKVGCRTRGMQDKRETGKEGCRKGGMKGRRDEKREGFITGRIQTGGIQDWRDT